MMDYFTLPYLYPQRRLEQIVFGLVFVMVGMGIYFSQTQPQYFRQYWGGNDGWVEWFTIIGLAFGGLVNLYRANILQPFRSNLFVVCTCLMGIMFFVVLGEEISWGQFLFDYQPPEFFIRYNTQGEVNFHHLRFENWEMGRSVLERILKPMITVYFLLLPLAYTKWSGVKNLVDQLALPLPRLYHTCAYIMLAFLSNWISEEMREDVLEFVCAWILVLMFCRPYNRELFSRISFER